MHPRLPRLRARRRAAYTVVEILVAMTIGAIVSALVMSFFVFNLRSIFHGEQKLLINGDIRDLTSTMMQQARAANFCVIYPSFHAQNSTTGQPVARGRTFVNGSTTVTVPEYRVRAGEAGDFLVLVYTADNSVFDSRFYNNNPADDPIHQVMVTRIVAYWVAPNRTPGPAGRNALYTFDTENFRAPGAATVTTPWGATLPVALTTAVTLESLLPPANAAEAVAAHHQTVINDLVGRALVDGADTGLNFINFADRSIIVQTRVLHGSRAKRVTNTYNFAITPRG